MREFFVNEVQGTTFTLFGPLHNILILAVLVGLWLIYHYRHKIKNIKPGTKEIIKYVMIFILYLNMFIYYNAYAWYGIYDIKVHLPFHFCYISSFSFMITFLLNKRSWFHVVYFFAFMGPLPAILWPEMSSSFDAFIFYQWIISHHVFLLTSFFFYYMYDFHIEKKDIGKVIIVANVVFLLATIGNKIFGTNYIFSNGIPEYMFRLYPFLKYINFPVLLCEITGLAMAFIAYIPVHFKQKEDGRLEGKYGKKRSLFIRKRIVG